MNKFFSLALALLALVPCMGSAQTTTWGTYSGTEDVASWGLSRADTYDVATGFGAPELVGKKIVGLRVLFANEAKLSDISNASAFLTKTLTYTGGKNVPDITSKSFNVTDHSIDVIFDTPYTMTSDSIFAGFSFDFASTAWPVATLYEQTDDGLWATSTSSSRNHRWRRVNFRTLAIQILVDGFTPGDVAFTGGDVFAPTSQNGKMAFTLVNHGPGAVSGFDYNYTLNGTTGTGHYDFATPIPAHYGAQAADSLSIPSTATAGRFPFTVTITKVNGNDAATSPSVSGNWYAYSFRPHKRPLVEEYTGTWCGWCPRGFVGMEKMDSLLGNDFVGVSYHAGDAVSKEPMEFTRTYPNPNDGFPACYIDRLYPADAYRGFAAINENHFHLDSAYAQVGNNLAAADLEATAAFTDSDHIKVSTTAKFAYGQYDGRYQMSYMLTADGLTSNDTIWWQHNYFSGNKRAWPDADMAQFVDGDEYVKGLVFNFVLVGRSSVRWNDKTLPQTVEPNGTATNEFTFDLKDESQVKESIIQDKSKLHVLALLIDTTTGEVSNAIKVPVTGSATTAIRSINAGNTTAVPVAYYSIDGRRIQAPQHGLVIIKYSDGHVAKVMK